MSRFDTIDLSRLPAPAVLEPLDFEALFAAFRSAFEGLLPDYDVGALETDPAMIAGQAFGFVRLLDRARVNDAARAVMLAFATGSDLDHLAALYGVARTVVTPAAGDAPAVLESDARFRTRVQLAPEALSTAGTRGAYVFHALAADPSITDVGILVPAPGTVHVVVMAGADAPPSVDVLDRVRRRIFADDVKMLTDSVAVRAVTLVGYSVSAVLEVPRGPDPAIVRSQAETALRAYAASRSRVGALVAISGLHGALTVAGVQRVILSGWSTDLVPAADAALRLADLTVTVEIIG